MRIGAYGIALDRMLFDRQRAEVLGQYEQAIGEWHAVRIDLERESAAHP